MSAYNAVVEAAAIYRRREAMDRDELQEAATTLAEHAVFSNRNIAEITGLPRHSVDKVTRKPERTGGRFNAEALELTLELIRARLNGQTDVELLRKVVLELEVSTSFLARLTGIPQRTIARAVGMP